MDLNEAQQVDMAQFRQILAELQRDALRYRWLRDNGRGDLDILWVYQGEELDRLIDSEISREKGANP